MDATLHQDPFVPDSVVEEQLAAEKDAEGQDDTQEEENAPAAPKPKPKPKAKPQARRAPRRNR